MQLKITTRIILSFILLSAIIGLQIFNTYKNTAILKHSNAITHSIDYINTKMHNAHAEEIIYTITGKRDNIFRSTVFMNEALDEWQVLSSLYANRDTQTLNQLEATIIAYKNQVESLGQLKETTETFSNALTISQRDLLLKGKNLATTENTTLDYYNQLLLINDMISMYRLTNDKRYISKVETAISELDPLLPPQISALKRDLSAYANNRSLDTSAANELNAFVDHYMLSSENLTFENNLLIEQTYDRIEQLNRIFTVATIIFTFLSMTILYRSVTKPINALLKQITIATQNLDLTTKIKVKSHDEISSIAHSFNLFLSTINDLVSTANDDTGRLKTSTTKVDSNILALNTYLQEIHTNSEELSATLESTAASSQEIAAASESLDHAMALVAKNAQEGAQRSTSIASKALAAKKTIIDSEQRTIDLYETSKENLDNAIKDSVAITEINTLSDIILAITDQTNLLALNATIEAARAGDAGNGFNVVATEIQRLAEHSKITASKIQATNQTVISIVHQLVTESTNLISFIETNVKADYAFMRDLGDDYCQNMTSFKLLLETLQLEIIDSKSSVNDSVRVTNDIAQAITKGASSVNDVTSAIYNSLSLSEDVRVEADSINALSNALKSNIDLFIVSPKKI